jgi:tryptophan-rich hypothetical protein
MSNPFSMRHLSPKKLLLSKWTATQPVNKEKHFLVTQLIEPETPSAPLEAVELEAVRTGRKQVLAWQQLKDESQWLQGWH